MKSPIRLFGLMATVAAAAITAVPAQAASSEEDGGGHAVFVQTNSTDGNAIAAYHRNGDGTLTFRASYPTGGLGGRAKGAGSDPLASQGSLTLIRDSGMLLAVNAGSDTISVFQVDGDQLHRTQVLPSGGPFPVGFAVHGDLVYVLDAGGDGFVSGFRIDEGRLSPIDDSTRALGLGNTPTPAFLADPAQVGFTPDGDHLIVTTKTHNTVDVFSVGDNGRPSAAPVKNAESPVPFAFDFVAGRLVLSLAGTSSLQTFTVNADNTLTPVSAAVGDTQGGLCWAIRARGFEYVSNTGSGSVSQFRVSENGNVTLVSAVAAPGILGATDSVAAGGQFLYVQSGLSGSVHAFRIGSGGALTSIQIAAVPDGDDQEGIAAS
jgi:6-phosphogluconolactonase (cycloisomerase 2 family)